MRFTTKTTEDDQIKATAHSSSLGEDEELVDSDSVVEQNAKKKDGDAASIVDEIVLKIPLLAVIYWCEKITVTAFGETFADFFS